MYKKTELFYTPVDNVGDMPYVEPVMTRFESAFLCGLLKKYRPKKILEVGVFRGGTTVVLRNCMDELGIKDYIIHSVDIYKKAGDMIFEYLEKNHLDTGEIIHNRFYFGNVLAEVIDEIGDGIDFVILDTLHTTPGELLDLLLVLPYCTKNAVICFHDLALDYLANMDKTDPRSFSQIPWTITKLCFSCITGDKIYHVFDGEGDPDMLYEYSNIGAVIINADTLANVSDLFLLLSAPWVFYQEESQLALYCTKYKELYGEEAAVLFKKITELNKFALIEKSKSRKGDELVLDSFKTYLRESDRLYLYGCGSRGVTYKKDIEEMSYSVEGFIVSDGRKKDSFVEGKPVLSLSEAIEKEGDGLRIVIATVFHEVTEDLEKNGISYFDPDERLQTILHERRTYYRYHN